MPGSVIAAQLYTVREFTRTPADIGSTLGKLGKMGYEAVQVSALGPIAPADLKEIADGEGLEIAATHVGYDEIRRNPQKVIEDHQLWDCRHVAIGSLPQEYQNGEGFALFAREASEAVRPLVDAGLTFSYHNHSFELEKFGARTGLDILYEESDPEVFSAEIDTYWIQHGGANPVSWLRKLEDRMYVVHLKDMAMRGREQLFAEVGEGNLEWTEILQMCRRARVEWYIVEQDICQRDPFESLEISLHNLHRMGIR